MNIALWIAAGVLASAFLIAGLTKVLVRHETLARTSGAGWVDNFSPLFVKLLGVIEIAASVGLILPAVVGVAPVLVPAAAIGVGMIMIGAGTISLQRHEPTHAMVNAAYLLLAAFVAWGRLGPETFS